MPTSMKKFFFLITIGLLTGTVTLSQTEKNSKQDWSISVLPSSIRLDPVTNKIIEERFTAVNTGLAEKGNLLEKNWIYDGKRVALKSARGEYVSFQLVVTNENPDSILKDIKVEIPSFRNDKDHLKIKPELFLEWAVNVKTASTGYPKASLGKGWYPDALIPFKYIQDDSLKSKDRLVYPLWIPDFNNRIDDQKSLIIWVDQYIPLARDDAKPGAYSTTVSVTISGQTRKIPIDLTVWNFGITNENKFKASLQHEGFLSGMNTEQELEIYQLFKRNRISLMDPTYKPRLQISQGSKIKIDWKSFDDRLKKYITGEAFTSKYGYNYGPGYGEPVETFLLPFDVYGKHGTVGWPNVGKPDVERNPSNQSQYINTIKEVRNHLLSFINSKKTDITVYLNGLDESYFPEAWSRMVYYGNMFHKAYPEAQFRVDGGYTEKAMNIIGKSINAWATHTINYNIDEIKKYQKMGIKDWLYGPMLYESKVNSWVGSSTFIDLPLVNDRAISWSCRKYNTYSWISWGIGAGWESGWYDPESWKDAYKSGAEADAVFSYKKLNGNALLIYGPGIVPNVDGPCPSIRLKTMRNGVQEYEYMRLLSELDNNNERVDHIVNGIIKEPFGDRSIGKLDVWSYDPEEWDASRITLGELINEAKTKAK
ncbi:MAG: glycoside hydrolase domain-containing protein [Ginsengibacter sp.]